MRGRPYRPCVHCCLVHILRSDWLVNMVNDLRCTSESERGSIKPAHKCFLVVSLPELQSYKTYLESFHLLQLPRRERRDHTLYCSYIRRIHNRSNYCLIRNYTGLRKRSMWSWRYWLLALVRASLRRNPVCIVILPRRSNR